MLLSHWLIPIFSRLARIKARYLVPTVLVFAILGTYAANNSAIDVWVMLGAGLLGILLRKHGFPLGPFILGFIVGPGAERALRQALLIGQGSWLSLLQSPIAIGFYLICLFSLYLIHRSLKRAIVVEE